METHVCPACGLPHYEQLKVGAGALIDRDGALLLVRRTREPFSNRWNLPAGYLEPNESPAQAALRETREETGLLVEAGLLQGVYFYDDDPRGSGLLIVYRCQVVGGALSESSEAEDATYFRREELPHGLAGGAHDLAVRAWQEMRR